MNDLLDPALVTSRHFSLLKIAFGNELLALLNNDEIIEIMANPDGQVWIDSLKTGKTLSAINLSTEQRLSIIKLIASYNHLIVSEQIPMLACEISLFSARFQAWLPPASKSATFTIRKKATRIFSLSDYVNNNWITAQQCEFLQAAVRNRLNILIAGGTGSGKTTFMNALLRELENTQERIIVLEDLPELQLSSQDVVTLKTTDTVSLRDLIKGALRMRPDRIIIGEVRDGCALDLLKAWNTGHPGGICTLHANQAESVKSRLADLILESLPYIPPHLIDETVDVIIFMKKMGAYDYLIEKIIHRN